MDLQAGGSSRLSLGRLSLCHEHTHLVDAEGSEGGGQQAGSAQNIPPVEEAEGDSFDNAVEAETHQRHGGEELHTQRRPGRFLTHDEASRASTQTRETLLTNSREIQASRCHDEERGAQMCSSGAETPSLISHESEIKQL